MADHPHAPAAADLLTQLVSLLYPHRRNLDLITLADIQRRYPLTGLGVPAMRAIEQSQRIVRATNDFHLMGLCEFHVGLIYLFWGDFRGASQQFAEARRQWSFVNATAAVCLSLFAEGRAQEFAHHHEGAMTCYGKAEQRLPRMRFDQSQEGLRRFASLLGHELRQAREGLRLLLQETWQDQENLPPGTAAPDGMRPQQTIVPVPQFGSPVSTGGALRWYRAERQQDGFAGHIPTGAYVQADTTVAAETAVSHYAPGEWVVVGLGDSAGPPHLLLTPYLHTEPYAQLGLARWVMADGPLLDVGRGAEALPGVVVGRVTGYWMGA